MPDKYWLWSHWLTARRAISVFWNQESHLSLAIPCRQLDQLWRDGKWLCLFALVFLAMESHLENLLENLFFCWPTLHFPQYFPLENWNDEFLLVLAISTFKANDSFHAANVKNKLFYVTSRDGHRWVRREKTLSLSQTSQKETLRQMFPSRASLPFLLCLLLPVEGERDFLICAVFTLP